MDEDINKIIVESINIGISLLVIIIGCLFVFFTLSWFDWFTTGRSVEEWIYTLRLIFIIFGFITIIYGIKRIIQNIKTES